MVAAACPAQDGDRVLDLGCGVGGAAFCLLERVRGAFISGIDIQPDYIDLARKNAGLNDKSDRIDFITSDIQSFCFSDLKQRAAHVLCNPPFLDAGTYIPSPDAGRATALGHEGQEATLKHWIDCAFHNTKPGGSLTLIHRADYIDRIIQAMGKRYGQVEIIPLWPRAGVAAKRVIIRARRDRKTPAIIHPGLVLHDATGAYTPEAERILRDAAPLL